MRGHALAPGAAGPVPERSIVRIAMVRFLLMGGLGLGVVALLTVVMASTVARSIARTEAESRTLTFTRTIAAPEITASSRQDMSGSPLVNALRNRLTDESISHTAVYDVDGRVLWSADPAAVGATQELAAEVTDLLGTERAVSHFQHETHAGGADDELVLEVYAASVGADGEPFVMEWYWPTSHLRQAQSQLMILLLPLTLGSLLLFAVLILPLTLATARRVERDRARLTRHAVDASRVERRRLSEDLHDGVVQDLAGIGYVLPMVGGALPEGSPAEAVLTQIRQTIQRDISTIRRMIADIRPVDLQGDGFREAVEDMAARMTGNGVQTAARLDCDVRALPRPARSLIYRVIREGAHNVMRHSGADHARIEVTDQASLVRVTVWDDGVGPGTEARVRPTGEPDDPHFGIALLAEAISDLDGDLELRAAAGGGTELVVVLRRDRFFT